MEAGGLGPQLETLREQVQLYLQSLSFRDHPFAILDIALVAIIFYLAYKFVKGTRAASIVWGMVIVGLIFALGRLLQLDALNWLLRVSITALLVAIPVVFQPELRRLLEKLGQRQPWRTRVLTSKRRAAALTSEITRAVFTLAESKTGGLIVITRKTGLAEYIDSGQQLDARVSSPLLLNIFFPNSPLHDGAVVIKAEKILAAGVILPLSDNTEVYPLGTRHKAALGISENSDALAIVVSEQRGSVGVAFNGNLATSITKEKLNQIVEATLMGTNTLEINKLLKSSTK